jgi:hypothetical protein
VEECDIFQDERTVMQIFANVFSMALNLLVRLVNIIMELYLTGGGPVQGKDSGQE